MVTHIVTAGSKAERGQPQSKALTGLARNTWTRTAGCRSDSAALGSKPHLRRLDLVDSSATKRDVCGAVDPNLWKHRAPEKSLAVTQRLLGFEGDTV